MELFENIIQTLLDPNTWIIVLVILAFAGIVGTVHFALKLNEAKKWDETQSSMYAKAIIRIADLQAEVSGLILCLKDKAAKLVSQSIHIEMLTDELKTAASSTKRKKLRKEIAELKSSKEFEIERNKKLMLSKFELIQEINELKLLNGGYEMTIEDIAYSRLTIEGNLIKANIEISELKDRIERLTETIGHRKHKPAKKELKTELMVESITDKYIDFPKGEIFKLSSVQPTYTLLMNVVAVNGNKFQVRKIDFKPVSK